LARSGGARVLFVCTAFVTVVVLWWAKGFAATHGATRLAPIFVYLFAALDYPGAVCALLILVAAAFVPQRASFRPLLAWIGHHTWPIAGGVFVLLCIGSLLVYLNHPLTLDEYAPYFQSRVFATGHLTGRFPPELVDWLMPPLFQGQFFSVSHWSGRIASTYWPAFALLMTPFSFLGISWACNPAISALTLPVINRLALRIFANRETAGLAVLLTLASPVFFADGISFYSMPAHLLANSVFALLLLSPTPRRAMAAGLVGSIALTLHNPVPHMLFAVPWVLAIARRDDAAKLVGCLLSGYLPLCLLLGVGWAVYIAGIVHDGGGPTAAQTVLSDGLLSRMTSVFSLPDCWVLLGRLVGIAKVWIWAVPGMLFLALAGAWKWRHNPHCRLLVASAVTTLVGYVLVPVDQGHGWGYRYFHSAWMALPLLAAGAMARKPVAVGQNSPIGQFIEQFPEEAGVCTYLVACALLSLTLGYSLRAVQIRAFMSAQLASAPAYEGTERRVVIMDPSVGLDPTRNDVWPGGKVTYLAGHGPAADVAMMRKYYPEMHRVFTDPRGSVWSTRSGNRAVD